MKKTLLFFVMLFAITLNSQTKIESAVAETFNGASWELSYGVNYEYDSNKNLVTETEFDWTDSGWEKNYKKNYTYNGDNKITENIEMDWDGTQWVNANKSVYNYNADGFVDQISEQIWDETQWINSALSVTTYDNLRPTISLTSVWNGAQWINESRSTITYTGNQVTQILYEIWSETQWDNRFRSTYTFNANNQRTNYRSEIWYESVWTENVSTDYIIDSNGNRTAEISIYDGDAQFKVAYFYDFSAQLANFAHPFKDKTGMDYLTEDFPYVNKILSANHYSYDPESNTYIDYTRTKLNYTNPLAVATNEAFHNLKIYPNPSNSQIRIHGLAAVSNIKIYNVLGNVVSEKVVGINENINIQNLSSGLYFVKFENGASLKFFKG